MIAENHLEYPHLDTIETTESEDLLDINVILVADYHLDYPPLDTTEMPRRVMY